MQHRFVLTHRYRDNLLICACCAVLITPLCGYLFACGCDWPWSGLDSHCNINLPESRYQCPWCTSIILGISAFIAATLTAIYTAKKIPISINYTIEQVIVRISIGNIIFIVCTTVMALITAQWQQYPYGIGIIIIP